MGTNRLSQTIAGYDPTDDIDVRLEVDHSTRASANGKNYAQLKVSSGSSTPDVVQSGNLTSTSGAGSTVTLQLGTGQGVWEAQFTGTFSSGTTIAFQGSDDATNPSNWRSAIGFDTSIANPPSITQISGPGPYTIRGVASGYEYIQMICTALHSGDNIAVRLIGSTGSIGGMGGTVTNDGTFAKESGGHLAVIDTATAAAKTDLDSILAALGTISDASWSGSGNGTEIAVLKKIATLLAATLAVSGSVTANAGTNLNTSLLALESGGNLAGIKADLDSIVTQTTGLATSANQSTGNTSLSSIATNAGNVSTVSGATTDAAVTGDNNGSLSAKLRGLSKIFADIWDSVNHRIKVDGSGVTQTVSGTVTANAGTNLNTSSLALESGGNLASIKTDADSIVTNTSNTSTALGATSDSAYAGSGNSSVVAALKGLYTKLGSVVLVAGSSLIGGVNLIDSAGTNKGKIDSNGNLQTRAGFTEQASLTAGSLNAFLVSSLDVSAYKWMSLQISGTWSGTLTFYGSLDGSNWQWICMIPTNGPTTNSTPPFQVSGNGIWERAVTFHYLQIQMTSYSSGTANAVLDLFTQTGGHALEAWVGQTGTWTVHRSSNNDTVPANTAANKVIKSFNGNLSSVVVTTLGTAALSFYDNASANSGTILLTIPASAAVGTIYPLDGWAKNGIVAAGVSNCPACTVYFD